jgi:hypothetical protein
MGDVVDPSRVAAVTSIPDGSGHKKGERRISRTKSGKEIDQPPWESGLWHLKSPLPENSELESHLIWLLNILEPRLQEIKSLLEPGVRMDLFCAFFKEAQGGVTISQETLERISKFRIQLSLEIYCVAPQDEAAQGRLAERK